MHDAPAATGMHGHDHGVGRSTVVLYPKLDKERDQQKFETEPSRPDAADAAPFTHAYLETYAQAVGRSSDPPGFGRVL